MPQRSRNDAPKEDWLCRTCQFRVGVPFKNFGSNKRCRGGCDLDKVNCYKGPAFMPGKHDPAKHTPGPANKQQQQHQQQMQQVQNQNKALAKQVKELLEKAKPDDSIMEVDTNDHPDAAKKELQKRVAYLEIATKHAKDAGAPEEESLARELEDTRTKLKDHMPTAGKHSLAHRKLKQASENRSKAETALAKGREALVEQQNKVAELIANLTAKKLQEEQARTEFLQTSAVQAGAGSMPTPTASTTAFPDLDPRYYQAEGASPNFRAFIENGGINELRATFEKQTADYQAEAARKIEEAQARIRTEAQAIAQAVASAAAAAATAQAVIETAAAFAAEALAEAAPTEEAEDEEAEDDEIMDDLLSPENLALLASSDIAGRRAVFKRMVKNHRKPGAESQAKKGKRG